ncbi:helix-turn-helix domain-containing protein [Bacillus thuringiensis]|uniref:helix-turn-helix domain-containing protein n=1 Tax=Bacillus thuringiensis TaxID=1428 RepID=UPI0034595881
MDLTGKEIKEIRLSLGLTLEEFGEKIDGANKSIVSKWERDETKPSPRRLKIINEIYRYSEINKLQNENIGEEIKNLRKSKGLTLMQVAEITDVSQPYLSHVEMGRRNPSAETLSKISSCLGVSKLYLYKLAGILDETDIFQLVDENKKLREALKRACNSLGAEIDDYLQG